MKTKITLFATAIWAVLVALNESNVLDLLPNGGDWLKFSIALIVVVGNALMVDPTKAKDIISRSIGGGGIKNPPPPPNDDDDD